MIHFEDAPLIAFRSRVTVPPRARQIPAHVDWLHSRVVLIMSKVTAALHESRRRSRGTPGLAPATMSLN